MNHDGIELYIQITLAAIDLARAKYRVPVVVLYFTSAEDSNLRGTGFDTGAILQRFRDGGAIVIDTSLRDEGAAGMALSIPGDGHPTAMASELRAAILKNYLEQNMPPVPASGLR